MADYGYLSHSNIDKRDELAIASVFAAVPAESVVVEQAWSPGEKRRPAFEALLKKLRPGDALYIHSIDRLGVDAADAAKMWRLITTQLKTDVIVLSDPHLDTRNSEKISPREVRAAAQVAFDYISSFDYASDSPCATFELLKAGTLSV